MWIIRPRYWIPAALGARLRDVGVAVLWSEHTPRPATRTSEAPLVERFSFVDLDRVRQAIRPPQPLRPFSTALPLRR